MNDQIRSNHLTD